ncbi:MAG: hypothetical protein GY899_04830 [Verrucomicrobiaceae bacterium]|nr:hypothetical protein [Verrucomicrobiaceae bacterium]
MAIACGILESDGCILGRSSRTSRRLFALIIVAGLLGSVQPRVFGGGQMDDQHLVADVETLNEIVMRYKRAGGWFSERDNAQRVMVRLAMAQGDFGITMLGKNSGHRMLPVIATQPPQSAKWAYWNVASEQFQVWRGVAPSKVQIVTRFARRQNAAPLRTPGLTGRGTTAGSGQAQRQPKGSNEQPISGELRRAGGSKGEKLKMAGPSLLPPSFDPPPGKFSVSEFETLSIHLRDPNHAGERRIHYSIDGASWKAYKGKAIRVAPGSEILAYCGSVNRDRWADSRPVAARYVLEPLAINLELKAPVLQLPAEALRVGKGRGMLFPLLTITNIATLPASLLHKDFIEVVWTIDGSDPLHSATAFPLTFSAGYKQGARLPLTVLSGQSSEKLRIRASARSTDRHLLLDTREAAIDLEIVR